MGFGVVACAAVEVVGAGAAGEGVVAALAVEVIVTGVAEEAVVAALAEEVVGASAAGEEVVAVAGVEGIAAAFAVEGISAVGGEDFVVSVAAEDECGVGGVGVDADDVVSVAAKGSAGDINPADIVIALVALDGCAGVGGGISHGDDGIIPIAGGNIVVTVAVEDAVVSRASYDGIVPIAGGNGKAAVPAIDSIISIAGLDEAGLGDDQVVAAIGSDRVISSRRGNRVGCIPCRNRIIAFTGGDALRNVDVGVDEVVSVAGLDVERFHGGQGRGRYDIVEIHAKVGAGLSDVDGVVGVVSGENECAGIGEKLYGARGDGDLQRKGSAGDSGTIGGGGGNCVSARLVEGMKNGSGSTIIGEIIRSRVSPINGVIEPSTHRSCRKRKASGNAGEKLAGRSEIELRWDVMDVDGGKCVTDQTGAVGNAEGDGEYGVIGQGRR